MTHLDADALALAAMNVSQLTSGELEHLAVCRGCSGELAALRRTADVVRSAEGLELQAPPDAVWHRIHADLGLSAAVEAPPRAGDPAQAGEQAGEPAGPPVASVAPVPPVSARVRPWRGWLPFAAVWVAVRTRWARRREPSP